MTINTSFSMKLNYILLLLVCPFLLMAQPGSESGITPINSTLTYQGFDETAAHFGTAEYNIYYDNIDGVLDKPIFFVDGFDPNDSRTIPLMYSLLNFGMAGENLGDLIRDEGYDLVVLNFPTYVRAADGATINGGADYIQRNAFILMELLNVINGMKTGTEENVVIGPSMGGLISRYALKYMEDNALDHETRLYVSFDSPHRGANVPMSIQYLFNYMVNGAPAITELAPLVDGLLGSPAAKQMLIDHFLGHVGMDGVTQTGSNLPIGAPNFRDAFQSELDGMGFPENTRNIAISNGSSQGSLTGSIGLELLNHLFVTSATTRATITLNFTPAENLNSQVTDFVGEAFVGIWIPVAFYSASSQSPPTVDGLDSAPGGQFDLNSFDDGSSTLITEFVNNLTSQYFNFIPTISGLAITETDDWYDLPNVSARFNTPFDASYIPAINEPHVQVNAGNVAFTLDEILNPPLSNDDFEINSFRIAKNPINDELIILSTSSFNNAIINIVDMTGKVVYNDANVSLDNRTSIPLTLESGLYILRIEADNKRFNTKIIIR